MIIRIAVSTVVAGLSTWVAEQLVVGPLLNLVASPSSSDFNPVLMISELTFVPVLVLLYYLLVTPIVAVLIYRLFFDR